MKILVLSDSHAALRFMYYCIDAVQPDVIIHLGDFYQDAEALAEDYPDIRLYQVPGNCDRYRCPPDAPEIMRPTIGGVKIYMTHGHKHHVKMDTGWLLSDAREVGAKAVLYGHTHVPNCYQDVDGLWILNPGSCGYFGGSAGVLEIWDGKVQYCRLLREADL